MEGVRDVDLKLLDSATSDSENLYLLLHWLKNNTIPDNTNHVSSYLESTTVHSFSVSFLNYVTSSTRPFLHQAFTDSDHSCASSVLSEQDENVPHNFTPQNIPTKILKPIVVEKTYDDDFPSLGSAPSKKPAATKQARRVNPTPTADPEVDSSFVLAKVQQSNALHSKTSKITPPHGPMKVDLDMLMNRVSKPKNLRSKSERSSTVDALEKKVLCTTRRDSHHGNCSSLISNTKIDGQVPSTKSDSLSNFPKGPDVLYIKEPPKQHFDKLKRLASIHAQLLLNKMVLSLVGELYFLLQLLCVEDLLHDQCKLETIQEKVAHGGSLFTDSSRCSIYACKVLEQAAKLLDCGEQLLTVLIEQPAISTHSPPLLSRLRKALVEYQSVTLRSSKSYEITCPTNISLQEAPSKFTNVTFSKQSSIGMPMSIPFDSARDSRHNFSTPASQKIYNNRELCRDQFYALIREAASSHCSFGFVALGQENDAYTTLKESVNGFLRCLMVDNYPWFSDLFVDQYLQASLNGETDPEVTGLAQNNTSKLQKLHVRLTSEFSSPSKVYLQKREPNEPGTDDGYIRSSPRSNSTKAQYSQPYRKLYFQPLKQNQESTRQQTSVLDLLLKAFPYSARIYVMILEAADSYRLSSQLTHTIRTKMQKLTKLPLYSHDAKNIGSNFTQRVIYLRSLAGLLGFLFFYPGLGLLPVVPLDLTSENSESEDDDLRWNLPIDLLEELEKAKRHESLLLVLPWILEFLRIKKQFTNSQACQLYFEKVLLSLKNLYSIPALDPSSDNFGVSSMCIHAALDSFFEEMGLLDMDKRFPNSFPLEDMLKNPNKTHVLSNGSTQKGIICSGVDRITGIVDSSYVQNFCPLLKEMRSLLSVVKKEEKLQRSQIYRNNTIRKITPVQSTKQGQAFHISNVVAEPSIMNVAVEKENDQLKLKLQNIFLDQRPHLQRLVDFLVDTVAVNAAHAATLKYVPELLEEAKGKLEIAILERFPTLSGILKVEDFEAKLSDSNFEAAVEHIICTSIEKALPVTVEYAKKHSSDRTVEALSTLAAPNESSYSLSVAAGVASEAAALAVSKKTIANVSSEIRKHVTKTVDSWRRKAQKQIFNESKELERVKLDAHDGLVDISADLIPSRNITALEKDRVKSSTNKFSKEAVDQNHYVRPNLNSELKKTGIKQECSDLDHKMAVNKEVSIHAKRLISERISELCKQLNSFSHTSLSDETRSHLRLELASTCLLMESILGELGQGPPAGGFDSIIFKPEKEHFGAILLPEEYDTTFKVETGLFRRSVALAAYWCLVYPETVFDLTVHNGEKCSYNSKLKNFHLYEKKSLDATVCQTGCTFSEHQDERIKSMEVNLQSSNSESLKSLSTTGKTDSQVEVQCSCVLSQGIINSIRNKNEYPMKRMLYMWNALFQIGLCKMEIVVAELFCPWRWEIALSKNPSLSSPIWFGATVHGLSTTTITVAEMAADKKSALKIVLDSIEKLQQYMCCKEGSPNSKKAQDSVLSPIEVNYFLRCIKTEIVGKV